MCHFCVLSAFQKIFLNFFRVLYVTTQAFLDSGSTNSFIAHDLIRQLKINETSIVDVIIQTIQSALEKIKAQLFTNIKICDLYESGCLSLHLLSLPSTVYQLLVMTPPLKRILRSMTNLKTSALKMSTLM